MFYIKITLTTVSNMDYSGRENGDQKTTEAVVKCWREIIRARSRKLAMERKNGHQNYKRRRKERGWTQKATL